MVQYKQTSIATEKRRSNHAKIQWALSSVCSFGTNQCHLCFKKEDKKKTEHVSWAWQFGDRCSRKIAGCWGVRFSDWFKGGCWGCKSQSLKVLFTSDLFTYLSFWGKQSDQIVSLGKSTLWIPDCLCTGVSKIRIESNRVVRKVNSLTKRLGSVRANNSRNNGRSIYRRVAGSNLIIKSNICLVSTHICDAGARIQWDKMGIN